MAARLRSDFFVAALIRQATVAGAYPVLRRRGAAEAGAVFVKVDHLDGRIALYGPASQSEMGDDGERRFRRMHETEWIAADEAETRIARETKFDSDLWLVEIDDRQGRCFLALT